jgi:hypothetical protein
MLNNKAIKLIFILCVSLFSIVGCSNLDNSSQQESLAETSLSTEEISESTDNIIINATYIETYFTEYDYYNRFDILKNSQDIEILLKTDSLDKYDDSFFEEKSLLAFTYIESCYDSQSAIKSYEITDNKITINVKNIKIGENISEGHWWFILELNKFEVDKIEQVEISDNKNQNINYNRITSLEKYIMQFNIDDEKTIWDGDTSQIVSFEQIHITLKTSKTYPEFKLEYLGIKEAINFEYNRGPFPPEYFFKEEYKYLLEKFTQSIVVYLEPMPLERFVEIIREIEKLPFVKDVYPNVFVDLC